jgi:hypothetical protein
LRQKKEIGNRKEAKDQSSEVRGQRLEDGIGKPEVGNYERENRKDLRGTADERK